MKDEFRKKHLAILHSIHLASGPYEAHMWLEKGEENIAAYSEVLSEKEYADSLQTLRVVYFSAKRKLVAAG